LELAGDSRTRKDDGVTGAGAATYRRQGAGFGCLLLHPDTLSTLGTGA
jgi:hypothetical protein